MKKLLGLLAIAPLTIASCTVQVDNNIETDNKGTTIEDSMVDTLEEKVFGEQEINSITEDLTLVEEIEIEGETLDLVWNSSEESVVRTDGEVIRPKKGEENSDVTLTANWMYADVDYSAVIDITILAWRSMNATLNFVSAFDDQLHTQIITWEEDTVGATPNLFDVVETGTIDEVDSKDIIIDNGSVDRMFGFGLDHNVDAYWELSTDGSDYEEITGTTEQNFRLVDGSVNNLKVNADELGKMNINVFGLNYDTGYSDVPMFDTPIEIAPHKSIYGQATPSLVSYGNETLFEMMFRHGDTLRASCNAEGYGAEHDFDCLFNHPGLGASLRGIAGVGSDWYASFLHFDYNGSSAGVGMGSMRANHGDVWTITWTALNCSAGWMCDGPENLESSIEQWEKDTEHYEAEWEKYKNSN